jgi:uncharacterized protein
MKPVATVALLCVLLCFGRTTGSAQATDANVVRLLKLSGSDAVGLQMIDLMMPSLQKMAPQVPMEIWQRLRNAIDAGGMIDRLVPVYAAHYSDEEVLQLIAFYETPLGKKVVRETPAVMRESYSVGQEWGQAILRDIIQELRRLGYSV